MFKTNEYFDGQVVSIAFQTETLPATVGVMAIGEYEFGTSQKETVSVTSGAMTVLLSGEADWKTIAVGESFEIDANKSFKVKVAVETAYLCLYG